MDDSRFDALTKALAADASRHRLLRGIGVAALGAVGMTRHSDEADAAKGRQCYGTGSSCAKGTQCCTDRVCAAGGATGRTSASGCPQPANPCQTAVCVGGQCGTSNVANGAGCDDGNACTTGTTCQNGACLGGSLVQCPPSGACHLAGTCGPAIGRCTNTTPASPAPRTTNG